MRTLRIMRTLRVLFWILLPSLLAMVMITLFWSAESELVTGYTSVFSNEDMCALVIDTDSKDNPHWAHGPAVTMLSWPDSRYCEQFKRYDNKAITVTLRVR